MTPTEWTPAVIAELERLEGSKDKKCPSCGVFPGWNGHAPDCTLDRLIRRAPTKAEMLRPGLERAIKIMEESRSYWRIYDAIRAEMGAPAAPATTIETPGTLVTVTGGDYVYQGRMVTAFDKLDTDQRRCVVQDENRRLFIHNLGQVATTPTKDASR